MLGLLPLPIDWHLVLVRVVLGSCVGIGVGCGGMVEV